MHKEGRRFLCDHSTQKFKKAGSGYFTQYMNWQRTGIPLMAGVAIIKHTNSFTSERLVKNVFDEKNAL